MDPNTITRHYQLKLMNDFMNIKYQNPKMKQSEIASQLKISTSSIQRQRNNLNMLSPYRINPKNVKKQSKKAKSDDNSDLKRPQKTSNDLKKISNETVKNKKNNIKGGSLQNNIDLEDRRLSGKKLIEQAFNTTINDRFY